MTKQEIDDYIKETLKKEEYNSFQVAMRCPNCSAKGCKFCNDGWIVPKFFLKEGE